MDATSLGTVFGGVAVLIALVAWLFPMRPDWLRRGLKVSMSTVMFTYGSHVEERNVQVRAVALTGQDRITGAGLNVSKPKRNIFPMGADQQRPRLPCSLGPSDTFEFWEPYREIGMALLQNGFARRVKIRGFVVDSTGKYHYSAPWRIDPTEWGKPEN